MNTRESLLTEFDRTDRRTRLLLGELDHGLLAVPYEPGINPPVWEFGHIAFFYEYFILRPLDHVAHQMPGFDEVWDSFEIHHKERWRHGVVPGKDDALAYYDRVTAAIRDRIATAPLTAEALYLYKYNIFHQMMHIESLIWSRQTLGYPAPSFVFPELAPPGEADPPAARGDAEVPGGRYPIGLPADSGAFATEDFGFDNEKPGHDRELAPFAISKTLVSNEEFRIFVESGAYGDGELWSFSGKCWLRDTGSHHPGYWRRNEDGTWSERIFDRWHPLDPRAPVLHVNYFEAEAYCRWAGRRLPTEFEWEAAARGPEGLHFPWGNTLDPERLDMDGARMARSPVTAFPAGASPFGCLQMLGTAWEWTSSQFLPYDGFKTDVYPYMSTLQFGDHKTTKGGSCAACSPLIRNTYRQAYYPSRRDVFVSFRTCAS